MSANDKRISHYASEYQHWDLAIKIPLGYLEGCSTKHVTRWRKKNGMSDLHKAQHYLEKLIELNEYLPVTMPFRKMLSTEIVKEVKRFAIANKLDYLEEEYILLLCTYHNLLDLEAARLVLEEIMEDAEKGLLRRTEEPNYPGTPEDGGHHEIGQTES
jgi:hypothetical protein